MVENANLTSRPAFPPAYSEPAFPPAYYGTAFSPAFSETAFPPAFSRLPFPQPTPGRTSLKGAQVVIHSTLATERGDKEFSVTGFFNIGSIKSIFHQTNIYMSYPRMAHPQH